MISFWKAFWALLTNWCSVGEKLTNSALSLASVCELGAKEMEDKAKAEREIAKFRLEQELNNAKKTDDNNQTSVD